MATLITSKGSSKILSPFRLNINTIVKSKAYKVIGEITGMNFLLYQSIPFDFTKKCLLKNPAKNGIPNYMSPL